MGIFILNVEMWFVILFFILCYFEMYWNLLYIRSIVNWVKKKVKDLVYEKYFWNIIDGVIY